MIAVATASMRCRNSLEVVTGRCSVCGSGLPCSSNNAVVLSPVGIMLPSAPAEPALLASTSGTAELLGAALGATSDVEPAEPDGKPPCPAPAETDDDTGAASGAPFSGATELVPLGS